jgi:hypothetical protein
MASTWYKWLILPVLFVRSVGPQEITVDPHPVYISVTEINHNAGDKTLEISCKIFSTDFETTLAKAFNTKIDLFNPRDKEVLNKQITDYIRKHLVIKADGKPTTLELVGFEREDDAIWNYFQVNNIAVAPKKVEVANSLLYDAFDQQINLLHVTVGGQRKSTKLNYPDANAAFEF